MSTRVTINLKAPQLKFLLIDSLKKYTDNVEYIDGKNPYRFSINKKITYILIKNVGESGKNRNNPDECRIQIANTIGLVNALNSEFDVLVFGYFADKNVFTAWDPLFFNDLFYPDYLNKTKDRTKSIYSRFSAQDSASENSISQYTDNNTQSVISFRPEYLGLYLENIEKIHFLREPELHNLVEFSDQQFDEDVSDATKTIRKEKYSVTHTKYKRDANFAKKVYEAYNHKCAMCGVGLGQIEAAHIVPHAHEKGSDEVSNGIALCALHHKAYDNSLIYFDMNYFIKLNTEKFEYLKEMGLDGGYEKFKALTHSKLDLPKENLFKPNIHNINTANKIRGIA